MGIVKMINLKKIGICLGIISAFLAVAATPKIVPPAEPSKSEQNAVKDLNKYLTQSVPKGLTVNGKADVTFYVGNTDFAKKNKIDTASLPEDTYVMRSIGNNIILLGGGSRGTEYAVYRFLEEYLKIRWYSMDAEKVPVYASALELPEINRQITPAFKVREIYPTNWRITNDGGLFAIRNRLNAWGSRGIENQFGGAVRFGSPDSSHTFDRYFPEAEYKAKHPEYFSLIDGKRVGGQFTGQLCLTNPEMTKIFIEKVKANIVKDEQQAKLNNVPAPNLYDVSQNDYAGGMCQCDTCAKIIEQEGAPSGLIIYFVNKIAGVIKEFRPNIYITTLAYGNTEKPPKNIKALDNVIIRLTNTSSNKMGSILDPEQAPHRQRVETWKGAAGMYIWEYPSNYGVETPPYPNEFLFADMFKFYAQSKVAMLFMEFSAAPRDDMPEMKMYLAAKLFENPDLDAKAVIGDFLDGYYGAAGKAIKAYRQLLYDSSLKNKSYVLNSIESYGFLDLNTVLGSYKLLDEAEKAVANDEALLARVRRVRYNLDMAAFMRFRRLSGEFIKSGKKIEDFPLKQDKLLNDIKNEWNVINNTLIRQDLRKDQLDLLKKFEDKYAGHPDVTPPPRDFNKFSDKAIDITIDMAKTHSLELRKDPESKTGFAVFVDWKTYGKSGAVPLVFGAYNDIKGQRIGSVGVIDPDLIPKTGYNYYYCMTLKPEFSGMVYFLDNWYIQFSLDSAAAKYPNQECDVYVSARFSGAPYKFGKPDEPHGLFIDRCIIVPK
jgi:hypothetical protein